jgi:virginiamycin B lyase
MTRTLVHALIVATVFPATATVATSPASAQEMKAVDIKEYPVPWGAQTRPRDPYVGPDGKVWFVGQQGNYIGSFDPDTEQFRQFELEEGTFPHNLVVDERGVWYAGNRNARVGRLDPATGEFEIFPMPDPAARDPHTLVLHPDGTLWFTVQNGAFIGHLDPVAKQTHLIKVPDRSRPYGIKLDAQGNPWVVLFGTNRMVKIDHGTHEVTSVDLPAAEARPRRIAITPDQRVWWVDHELGQLGVHDPKTGQSRTWDSPGGAQSRPYAMDVDDRGRIWYVEGGSPNHFVGFDPTTESFISNTPLPSGGGTVRHMMFDPRTRQIWFGTDTGNIGRAVIPQ